MKPCVCARVYQKEWLTNLKEKRKKKKEMAEGSLSLINNSLLSRSKAKNSLICGANPIHASVNGKIIYK
jgi:hypothetical protein